MCRRSGEKQGNIKLSINDWISLNTEMNNYTFYKDSNFMSNNINSFEMKFMGIPIIFTSSGITAWFKCEYCQTETIPDKKNGYSYCVKCGALI